MTDAHRSPRSDATASGRPDLRTETQRISASVAYERYLEELAYYQADQLYLPVEKCAARCAKLSALLAASLDISRARTLR